MSHNYHVVIERDAEGFCVAGVSYAGEVAR